MAIKAFKFKPKHLEGFEPQEMQEQEWWHFQKLREDNPGLDEYLGDTYAVTLQENDRTNVIYGWIPAKEGGANGWLFFSKFVGAKEMVRTTIQMNKDFDMWSMLYDWIQTPIRDDYPEAARWIKLLGFYKTDDKFSIEDIEYTYWKRGLDGI